MAKHTMELELWYDGAWNTAPVYERGGCVIKRGTSSPGSDSEPSSVELVIDNTSGDYAPLSVASTLYGKIGQNTKARVTVDGDVRLVGEVASWIPERAIKGDAWTTIQVAGVLQRLGRGTDNIQSAATRTGLALEPFAYWSLEGSAGALTPDTPALVEGAEATRPAVVWADDDTLVGSLPLPQVLTETSEWDVSVLVTNGVPTNSGTAWSISVWLRQEPLQDAILDTWYPFYWEARPPGAIQPWALQTSTSGSNSFGYTTGAGGAVATNHGPDLTDAEWHHVVMMAEQAGSTISGQLYIDGVAGTTLTPATDTLMPLTSFAIYPGDGLNIATPGANAWLGGLGFYDRLLTADEVESLYRAGHGWDGELAEDRFTRFCEELAITPTVIGEVGESVAMGAQVPAPILDEFDEVARTDDGSVFETRDDVGLTLRTGNSKLNQTAASTISYLGEIVPGLLPVYGDKGARNDVTARSPQGASRRVQQLTGPRNVQLPEDDPQGIGRYQTTINTNPATEDALSDSAGWRVNLGTYDGTWYAVVTADLDAAPHIATAAAALDIGDVLALSDLPVDEALDTVPGIIIGSEETVENYRRTIRFFLIPAAPYMVGVLAETSGDTGDFLGHLDTDGSTTVGATAASASAITVATPSGPLWTVDSDDYPFDLIVGGQRVSVSGAVSYLNANPYFETNVLNWTGSNGSAISRDTTAFHQGAAAMLIIPNGVASTPTVVSEEIAVTVGRTYTYACWLRISFGGSASRSFGIAWYDSAHALLSTSVQTQSPAATVWTSYGGSAAAPVGAAYARLITTGPGVLAVGNTWRVDEATIGDGITQIFTVQPSGYQVVYPIPADSAVNVQQPIILAM